MTQNGSASSSVLYHNDRVRNLKALCAEKIMSIGYVIQYENILKP